MRLRIHNWKNLVLDVGMKVDGSLHNAVMIVFKQTTLHKLTDE